MKPFSDLTDVGRLRRLHRVARIALEHYDIDVESVAGLANDTNTIFRVDTRDGRRFALRVAADPEDTETHTPTEVAWLRELVSVPEIDAVRVVETRAREGFVTVDTDGVPGSRDCVLFSWVPGRPVGDAAGPDDYHRLGVLAARLHDHGERWRVPADLHPLVWDRVFYYPTEPVVMYDDRHAGLLTPRRRRIVEAVESLAADELTRLHGGSGPIIVHGDLHPWNVHTHDGGLIVFDFEDLMVAAPVQDIAITLFYNRDHPAYGDLCAAYEDGYRSVRDWPVAYDGQLEVLMAARTVNMANYVIRTGRSPEKWIPIFVERIQRVL